MKIAYIMRDERIRTVDDMLRFLSKIQPEEYTDQEAARAEKNIIRAYFIGSLDTVAFIGEEKGMIRKKENREFCIKLISEA